MGLRLIAGGPCRADGDDGDCMQGDCPGVFVTGLGTVVVQGKVVRRTVPEGEAVVEIPEDLLREAGRFLLKDPDLDQYREWKRIAIEPLMLCVLVGELFARLPDQRVLQFLERNRHRGQDKVEIIAQAAQGRSRRSH